MAEWPYNTAIWARLRRAHLSLEPLCRGCKAEGRTVSANTVDHVVPIIEGGEPFPPHDGLASYCSSCHSAKTARGVEAGAIRSTKPRRGCNPDGTPLDPAHPWRGGDGRLSKAIIERRMPSDLKPSRIPIVIVTGPPGSGKSTYVREHAGKNDIVICVDTIMQAITGRGEHENSAWALPKALNARNAMLRSLATDERHERAWFIVSAPDPAERRLWAHRLGGQVVVIDTPLPECIRRIRADPSRPALRHGVMIEAATRWWQRNPHLKKSLRADAKGPALAKKTQLVRRGQP